MKRPAWSSSPRAWAWIGGGVAMAIAAAVFDPYLFTGGDNVRYYALAKALATGRGYVDLITPGTPPETVYPPGFALLLVPFYWIFGGAYTGLKVESLVAGGVALWGLWSLARRDPAHAHRLHRKAAPRAHRGPLPAR